MHTVHADEAAVGFSRTGALHVGVLQDVGGEPKMVNEVVVEYYTLTDHWRVQRPNKNQGWRSRVATIAQEDARTTLDGMIGFADYTMSLDRLDDKTFDLNWTTDTSAVEDTYRALNKVGSVIVFRDDDEIRVSINGEPLHYQGPAGEQLKSLRGTGRLEQVEVAFPSGKVFVFYDFDGLISWDASREGGRVLLMLESEQTKGEGIRFGMKLSTKGQRVAQVDSNAFEFQRDHDDWFRIDPPDSLAFVDSPSFNFVDLSDITLDPPAGKHGFLEVRNGQFYFEDGTGPVRFAGTTLVHSSKFPTRAEAELLAERIASMGCNVVRLHHIDYYLSGMGIFDREQFGHSTQQFDVELMDRMDYLIHQLKMRGVYIHLDAISARQFRENDGVPAHNQLTRGIKGSAFVYESDVLLQQQKDFIEKLWTHENPYTGLKYKDEPAIVTAEIINESDLFTHGTLDHHFPQPYRSLMEKMFQEWTAERDLPSFTYRSAPRDIRGHFQMNTMRNYFRIMYRHMRDLGVRVPIAGTNWIHTGRTLATYAAQQEMDYTAAHPYGEAEYFRDPPHGEDNRAGFLAVSKMINKPLIHNEWNMRNSVGITRTASILYQMALIAAAGHDGSHLFAMFHNSLDYDARHINSRNTGFDPAVRALYPAAVLLMIRGDMATSPEEYVYRPPAHQLLVEDDQTPITRENRDAFLPDFSRAAFWGRAAIDYVDVPLDESPFPHTPAFPDSERTDLTRIEVGSPDMLRQLPSPNAYPAVNHSGEIVSYWKDGYYLIRTPRAKWAVGYLPGGEPIDLGDDVSVMLDDDQFACVTISSMEDVAIADGAPLMIATVSYVEQPDMYFDRRWEDPRNLKKKAPIAIKPVRATLTLPSSETRVLQAKTHVNTVAAERTFKMADSKISVRLDDDVLVYELKNKQ